MIWFDEYIKSVPRKKWLYFFMKVFLLRFKNGLRYKELYMILNSVYKLKCSEKVAKNKAMNEITAIYEWNQNNG